MGPGPIDRWRNRRNARISPGHRALAFTAVNTGLVPQILSALGTSAPVLRAAILDSDWQAS